MCAWRTSAAGMGVVLVLTGCASHLAPGEVYRSSKGYRVKLPGEGWRVANDSGADLELQHGQASAAMLVNASCDPELTARTPEALRREILAGLSEREVQERDAAVVAGREASHVVLDARYRPQDQRVRLELFVLKGERCVYDLLYAAPPALFERWRPDFQRLVETLTLE